MTFAYYRITDLIPQQNTHLVAHIICQGCNSFGGYPRDKYTKDHIDGKIDRNIHRIDHSCAVKAIVKEYVQGLHNQKLPYNQGKALFSQKLCKFVAQQSVVAEATMYANDHKACSESIECHHVYEAWK